MLRKVFEFDGSRSLLGHAGSSVRVSDSGVPAETTMANRTPMIRGANVSTSWIVLRSGGRDRSQGLANSH